MSFDISKERYRIEDPRSTLRQLRLRRLCPQPFKTPVRIPLELFLNGHCISPVEYNIFREIPKDRLTWQFVRECLEP